MKDTKIEWCDSTVNPTGFQCQGCELWMPAKGVKECYAGRFAERIGGVGAFDKPVELKPGRMAEAARWSDLRGKPRPNKPWIPAEYPRIIFIGDMADTLQAGVPFVYLFNEVIANVTSERGRRHIWMWLTKDAKRLEKFNDYLASVWGGPGNHWPKNLWPGVSVTSNQTTWRIWHLLQVPAARRFISYEPAWEYVNFNGLEYGDISYSALNTGLLVPDRVDQIIIGGESGAGAKKHPFNVGLAYQTIRDCTKAKVACFVKQLGACVIDETITTQTRWPVSMPLNGNRVLTKHSKGGDWSEWPDDLCVREFPSLP